MALMYVHCTVYGMVTLIPWFESSPLPVEERRRGCTGEEGLQANRLRPREG